MAENERELELLKMKEKLDSMEVDKYMHGYELNDDMGYGEISILQMIVINSLVHKELEMPYESWYEDKEGFPDYLRK